MGQIVDQFGRGLAPVRRGVVKSTAYRERFHSRLKAKYDAAQTSDENERHWASADGLSARAAHCPEVRRKIRQRARYEAQESNSYAKGIMLTLANDTIGTGARLQLLGKSRQANQHVEAQFHRWAKAVGLASKLRTQRLAKGVDGESFAILTTNPVVSHPVKLDLRLIEADQVATPWLSSPAAGEDDGIVFDSYANPTTYRVLRQHPGDGFAWMAGQPHDNVAASQMIHLFRVDRPGQVRGVSEIVTALPLFAMFRRFRLATLAAAETAADFAAVMHTDSPGDDDAESLGADEWFDAIPIEHRALLTLPNGWKMSQLKAEHPGTTFDMFSKAIISEIARCVSMPYNIAAADSSAHNFASGRLDHQVYYRSIRIEQSDFEAALDRIFLAWLMEAVLIPGILPDGLGLIGELAWQWMWDDREPIDPVKESASRSTDLSVGATSYPEIYARKGKDWVTEQESQAEALGVSVQEYQALLRQKLFGPSGQQQQPQRDDPAEAARVVAMHYRED